jgi:hypothetical protein
MLIYIEFVAFDCSKSNGRFDIAARKVFIFLEIKLRFFSPEVAHRHAGLPLLKKIARPLRV